jgi:hypothetical protein
MGAVETSLHRGIIRLDENVAGSSPLLCCAGRPLRREERRPMHCATRRPMLADNNGSAIYVSICLLVVVVTINRVVDFFRSARTAVVGSVATSGDAGLFYCCGTPSRRSLGPKE